MYSRLSIYQTREVSYRNSHIFLWIQVFPCGNVTVTPFSFMVVAMESRSWRLRASLSMEWTSSTSSRTQSRQIYSAGLSEFFPEACSSKTLFRWTPSSYRRCFGYWSFHEHNRSCGFLSKNLFDDLWKLSKDPGNSLYLTRFDGVGYLVPVNFNSK